MSDVVTRPLEQIVLELRSVSRHYRGRVETVEAVTDVTLDFAPHSLTALAGSSGSGKTTLIHLMLGWEQPDSGSVVRRSGVAWTDIAVVPQGLGLLDDLTIGENIELPIRLGASVSITPDEIMEQLGIAELAGRRPSEVSLGEQQRASIARAMVCQSDVLIADEPTAHQDEDNANLVFALFERAADLGTAVIVATHETRLLDRVDRVVRMTNGQIEIERRSIR